MTIIDPAESWLAERRGQLIASLLAQRPPVFAAEGRLDGRIAEWASALAGGHGRNLVITGPVGTGKSWSLWRAAEMAIRAGYEGRVSICPAARFKHLIAPQTADPREYQRLLDAGLLALDDIGSVRLSEWDSDHLAEVADERWSNRLPTVITSNLVDLESLLGPRIASRIADGALIVELDGPDRRRQR